MSQTEGRQEANQVHLFNCAGRRHVPAESCWCRPECIFENEAGAVWVHRGAGRLPSGREIAGAIALLYEAREPL